jgi:hypothetical protein
LPSTHRLAVMSASPIFLVVCYHISSFQRDRQLLRTCMTRVNGVGIVLLIVWSVVFKAILILEDRKRQVWESVHEPPKI